MELILPFSDFNLNPSPFLSAPSSPKQYGLYSDDFHSDDFSFDVGTSQHSVESPKFSHDFSFELRDTEQTSLSAEELFHCGKIRSRNKDSDAPVLERGRDWRTSTSDVRGSRGSRGSRSLSPLRNLDQPCVEDQVKQKKEVDINNNNNRNHSCSTTSKGYRKWRLKDFLLFRSASEGRESGKARPKYASSSFQAEELSRRKGHVSAHEVHYTANRAVAEDMKRKTLLPYKQHGRFGFRPFF